MQFFKKILTFGIAFFIIGYLVYFIDWNILLEGSDKINIPIVTIGILIFITYPFIVGLRWKKILFYNHYYSKINECLVAAFHSFSLNLFVPAKSGDLIKALSMKSIDNKPKLLSIIISERLGDIIVLGCLIFFSNLFYFKIWEFLFGLVILLGIFLIVFMGKYIKINFKKIKLQQFQEIILNGLAAWRLKPFKMLHVSSYSLLNWLIGSFQVWLFFISFDVSISYLTVVSIFPITILISIIPITPAGIGIRETAFLVFFSNYANPDVCVIVGLLYFLSSTALNSVLGSFFIKTLFIHK